MEAHKTDRTTGEPDHGPFQPFEDADKEVRKATGWWWLYVLLGLVSIALGVTALASRITAVATLVAVLAVFLIYTGVAEIVFAATIRRHAWAGILAGIASLAAGIIALAWPGITLYVLVIFVGASLIAWGIYRIYLSFTDPAVRPRAVTLIEGLALMAIGTLALAWPKVSILVLAVLVSVAFIVFGAFAFVGGLHLLDLHHAARKAHKEADKVLKGDTTDVHHHAA